jgi:hypothetical protein
MLNILCLIALIPLWALLFRGMTAVFPDGLTDALAIPMLVALYIGYALVFAPSLPNW